MFRFCTQLFVERILKTCHVSRNSLMLPSPGDINYKKKNWKVCSPCRSLHTLLMLSLHHGILMLICPWLYCTSRDAFEVSDLKTFKYYNDHSDGVLKLLVSYCVFSVLRR
jgi:hypothetical protein